MRRAASSQIPAPSEPRAAGRKAKTLYQAKALFRREGGTVSGSIACSIGEKGPASCPFGLSVPSTAPAISTRGPSAMRRRAPPTVSRGAVHAMIRAGPIRAAKLDSSIVRRASSTMVAVKTNPIWAEDRPRRARKRARTTESHPKAKERTARAANSRRPSRLSDPITDEPVPPGPCRRLRSPDLRRDELPRRIGLVFRHGGPDQRRAGQRESETSGQRFSHDHSPPWRRIACASRTGRAFGAGYAPLPVV